MVWCHAMRPLCRVLERSTLAGVLRAPCSDRTQPSPAMTRQCIPSLCLFLPPVGGGLQIGFALVCLKLVPKAPRLRGGRPAAIRTQIDPLERRTVAHLHRLRRDAPAAIVAMIRGHL